ncbi:MAG: 50S ribosomal protein L29 [Desulfatiglandales bacterium]
MKAKELRELDEGTLRQKAMDLKQEIFNLRFQLRAGQLLNVSAIRNSKRDLARVLTVMKQKGYRI